MRLAAGLVLALPSTAALSCGFYLQHTASGALSALSLRHPLSSLSALFTHRRWLTGFAAGLSGWALYIVALGFAPLAFVQATSAGGVGLLALLVRYGGGRLTRPERLAVAVSVIGLALLGLSLPAGAGHAALPGWMAPFGWVLASAAVCHGLAFVCLQLGFQRGAAMATAGVSTLLTNVLPILAGLTIFAEPMPGGAAGVLRGLGFAGAVLGAVLLAAAGHGPAP